MNMRGEAMFVHGVMERLLQGQAVTSITVERDSKGLRITISVNGEAEHTYTFGVLYEVIAVAVTPAIVGYRMANDAMRALEVS